MDTIYYQRYLSQLFLSVVLSDHVTSTKPMLSYRAIEHLLDTKHPHRRSVRSGYLPIVVLHLTEVRNTHTNELGFPALSLTTTP